MTQLLKSKKTRKRTEARKQTGHIKTLLYCIITRNILNFNLFIICIFVYTYNHDNENIFFPPGGCQNYTVKCYNSKCTEMVTQKTQP